ncbi:MAG: gliding motility-associated C-terminal domain-containing protein [Bacteroidales bacterium]|nr:gliding motility-associated C-terminal domain-containing protein [Bacteroidales bacterium]
MAISEDLCPDSAFSQITVYPAPTAKFTVDKTVACSPLEINITNTSAGGDTYVWDYDDGTVPDSVTNTNPFSYSYSNDLGSVQTIKLKLNVLTDNGCSDNLSQNLTVYPGVSADFERDSAGCSPYSTAFTNNSAGTSNYLWSLGDGTASLLENPTHTYVNNTVNNQVFKVTLTGSSGYGCADTITKQITVYPSPVARFDYSPIYQYYPSATVTLVNETNEGSFNFRWDYDDGTITFQKDPGNHFYTHWGEYDITLIASSVQCSDTVSHWIKIFPPLPVAAFITDVDSGCVPLTVSFYDKSVYAEEYEWNFDDGGSSLQAEPVYTFTEPGLYQVKQTVKGEGGEDIAFREIKAFRLPEVDFKVEPNLIMLPDQYAKTFNFSEYGVRYFWDFGDGTTYDSIEPAHLYTELGKYDVSLEVWTKHGCEGYLIKPLEVEVVGAGIMKFPNAFAPNMSGPTGGIYDPTDISNQTFHPVHDGVIKYSLMIYNRWGELVFETTDVHTGWDGYIDGKLAPQAVYIYKVEGNYTNGARFKHLGDVTLLHKPKN